MGVVDWTDIIGGPAPTLIDVGLNRHTVRPEISRVVAVGTGTVPDGLSGALLIVDFRSPSVRTAPALSGAAGVVVVGGRAAAEKLAAALPMPVMIPAAEADTDTVSQLIWERAAAANAQRARRAEELLALVIQSSDTQALGTLTSWCSRELGARVRLLSPYAARAEFAGAGVEDLVQGRDRGPVSIPEGLAVAVGVQTPMTVLCAQRPRPAFWSIADVTLLEQVAGAAAAQVRAEGLDGREQQLDRATAEVRWSAVQQLMTGDLGRARLTLKTLAPGLAAAGTGRIALVECGHQDPKDVVATAVEHALGAQSALVVGRPADPQVIVLSTGTERLEELLAPVVADVAGRAAGISRSVPWPQLSSGYEAAVAALARARGMKVRLAVDDARVPLVERLSGDARIWAELVLQPLFDLPPQEREELLDFARQTLWWGESVGARLSGLHRQVLNRRMDALSARVGLNRHDPWQRAALYLAVRLISQPVPARIVDRSITLDMVLDHKSARAWAAEILNPVPDRTRQVLAQWVASGMSAQRAMAALGMSRTTLYRHLKKAAAGTHLDLTAYPGPAAEAALALHVTGEVVGSLPSVTARQLPGRQRSLPRGLPHVDVDFSTPHAARMLAYFQGAPEGLHGAADRAAADRMLAINPHLVTSAETNRRFIRRAVRFLVKDHGITQFVDLGSGITTHPNLHEMAQAIRPDSRVVYLDNDPVVQAQSGPLLASTPEGRTAYVEADVREGANLYQRQEITNVLDLEKPVAVCMNALLHFFSSDAEARDLVRAFTDPLVSGSYLMLTHITHDWAREVMEELVRLYRKDVTDGGARSKADLADLVAGLEVVDGIEHGIVPLSQWRPDTAQDAELPPEHVNLYGLVARIP